MKDQIRPSARPALLALGVLGSTALLAALGTAQEEAPRRGGPPRPPAGVTSAHYFKNIKVLKTLPANQLIPTMQVVSRSLGVDCGFCHERGNFASDAKPTKNVARQMIVMTNFINTHEKIVDRKASCYMCHHGHATPETMPPAGSEERGERPPGPPQ